MNTGWTCRPVDAVCLLSAPRETTSRRSTRAHAAVLQRQLQLVCRLTLNRFNAGDFHLCALGYVVHQRLIEIRLHFSRLQLVVGEIFDLVAQFRNGRSFHPCVPSYTWTAVCPLNSISRRDIRGRCISYTNGSCTCTPGCCGVICDARFNPGMLSFGWLLPPASSLPDHARLCTPRQAFKPPRAATFFSTIASAESFAGVAAFRHRHQRTDAVRRGAPGAPPATPIGRKISPI